MSLASFVYKIYCSILKDKLYKWAEDNKILEDKQGEFRKKRSNADQISSLTSIIDTRKKRKLSTFAAFIDLKR